MNTKGLYSDVDQRYNMWEIPNIEPSRSNDILKQARSVGCLIDESFLEKVNKNGWKGYHVSKNTITLIKTRNLEGGVRFGEQLAIGNGTAFLVGKQHMLTAAHCVCSELGFLDSRKIERMRVVFEFQMLAANHCKLEFPKNHVYRIENVVAHQLIEPDDPSKDWIDWALLKLQKIVNDREPLKITFSNSIATQKRVYMLGHPCGLPMKWTRNGEVKKNNEKNGYFEASLDAFEGNSGSPVFLEETGEVIGMHFRGNRVDYENIRDPTSEIFKRGGPRQVSQHQINAYGFEICQKVTSLMFVKAILSSIDNIPAPLGQIGNIKEGLSLEATCSCNNVNAIVISRGFGNFDLGKECTYAICSSCQVEIDLDNVNTMILSSCQYYIEGMNRWNQKIKEGPFKLLKGKGIVRFDVRNWYYLELKVTVNDY